MDEQKQSSNLDNFQGAQDEPDQIDAIAEKRGWFRPDPDEATYPIVKDYMNGSLDVNTTVEKLAAPIEEQFSTADKGRAIREGEKTAAHQRQYHSPEKAKKMWGVPLPEDELPPERDEDDATTEGLLWELWYSILHTAKRTPWRDTAGQTKLLDLVRTLKARPDPPLPTQMTIPLQQNWMWSSGKLWSELLMIGPATRESWNDTPRDWGELTPAEIHAWTNVNAFIAKITKEGLANFWLYAIWAMREALEDGDRTQVAELDAVVPAAASWVLVAGEGILKKDEVWKASFTTGDPAGGGRLWKGKKGFCKERFGLWKRGFQVLSQRKDLNSETREISAEAFLRMGDLEIGQTASS